MPVLYRHSGEGRIKKGTDNIVHNLAAARHLRLWARGRVESGGIIGSKILWGINMSFQYDDGGRAVAGYKGRAGDCVTRAIAIATGKPYPEVYEALWDHLRSYASDHRDKVARQIARGGGRLGTTPRNGVNTQVFGPYLESLGWIWVPTMHISQGCKVHLCAGELPTGKLVVRLSRHITAVIDGVIHDVYDPSRDGSRCVYGYWYHP